MITFQFNAAALRQQKLWWHTRLLNARGWFPELDAWIDRVLAYHFEGFKP